MSTVVEGAAAPTSRARDRLAYYPGCSLHGTSPRVRREPARRGRGARHRHRRDPRLELLRREQRPHHRPPARRRPAGAQPGAGRGAGLRPRAGSLRRLLQPPARRRTSPWRKTRPRRADARDPRPPVRQHGRRAQRRARCCATSAPAIAEKVAAPRRAQPHRRRQAGLLLRLPARPPAGGRRRRRPRAADVHGRRRRRLRRRGRRLEHEGRVLRRRVQREPHLARCVRLGRAIIEDARAHGAEAIVVACPLCHTNLDLRQKAMESRGEPSRCRSSSSPQVVGLALGLSPEDARPRAALRRHRAAARATCDARRRARRGRAEG